jgi:hypothetical protein
VSAWIETQHNTDHPMSGDGRMGSTYPLQCATASQFAEQSGELAGSMQNKGLQYNNTIPQLFITCASFENNLFTPTTQFVLTVRGTPAPAASPATLVLPAGSTETAHFLYD